MNTLNHKAFFATVLAGFMISAVPLMAQQYELKVDDPDFDDLLSPNINANTKEKNWKPKEWLEVEVKFRIVRSSDKDEKYADRVTVKWYVAAEVQEGTSSRDRVLEKEVDYVNVPIGEDIHVSVYLSPSAVERISGRERAGKSIVKGVGGEILVNGSPAYKNSGFFTTEAKSKGKWWDSMARYNKIPLLNKNETPFKFLWWDHYAEIEERR